MWKRRPTATASRDVVMASEAEVLATAIRDAATALKQALMAMVLVADGLFQAMVAEESALALKGADMVSRKITLITVVVHLMDLTSASAIRVASVASDLVMILDNSVLVLIPLLELMVQVASMVEATVAMEAMVAAPPGTVPSETVVTEVKKRSATTTSPWRRRTLTPAVLVSITSMTT